MKFSNKNGQAMFEYLLIFSFMAVIAWKMFGVVNRAMKVSVGGLGHALTRELTIGVCKRACFYSGYLNGVSVEDDEE